MSPFDPAIKEMEKRKFFKKALDETMEKSIVDLIKNRLEPKLYAFYPSGHGVPSFFVIAFSKTDAISKINTDIDKNKDDYNRMYLSFDFPSDYECEEFEINQVATNDNS